MINLVYNKQIIHLSGPVDETSFFPSDRLILVLGQKGTIARLPLKYTNIYLFTSKTSVMVLMG